MRIDIIPGPAASATALPDIDEKITLTRMLTCARPPRARPTTASAARQRRSEMVPAFIMLAARMNMGIASMM